MQMKKRYSWVHFAESLKHEADLLATGEEYEDFGL
jgi:hypothetical protein